jgi:glucose-6-phosphate isomerase
VTREWRRYRDYLYLDHDLGVRLDVSDARVDESALSALEPAMGKAFTAVDAIESGAVANADEGRMVGHYWLRAPDLAPPPFGGEIRAAVDAVAAFAGRVHAQGRFLDVVHVGIGGSALGPQLLADVLAPGRLALHFLDNADPDGIDTVLGSLRGGLDRTLVSMVSKSGFTPTPAHVLGQLDAAYRRAGLDLADHAVATTMAGTDLDVAARAWLARFPIWDWVGGRTSVTSAVGLLPAALAGGDIHALLDGAAAMDRATRLPKLRANPAALLAAVWYTLGAGRGAKHMVVLPYRDRLARFPRYVQQLVMESVGKRVDRTGRVVHQGLTVYGHKGSTDQHAYLQQLHEGPDNCFVTFVAVRSGGGGREISPGVTLGDYLYASLEGTREALTRNGRDSVTITLPDLSLRSVGALIALYERAVGLYAELIDVNAYHQPGVDKHAAEGAVALQRAAVAYLRAASTPAGAEAIAAAIGAPDRAATVHRILENLALAGDRGIGMRADWCFFVAEDNHA